MTVISQIAVRPARRDDVAAIIAMLADDHLGRARERLDEPLPKLYYDAFERVRSDPNIHLIVAEEGGNVVGCLALHPAGVELARRPARPDRGCARRLRPPQPRHRREAGAMGARRSARQRLQAGRALDPSHPRRRPALLRAYRILAQPCRDDDEVLDARSVHLSHATGVYPGCASHLAQVGQARLAAGEVNRNR